MRKITPLQTPSVEGNKERRVMKESPKLRGGRPRTKPEQGADLESCIRVQIRQSLAFALRYARPYTVFRGGTLSDAIIDSFS